MFFARFIKCLLAATLLAVISNSLNAADRKFTVVIDAGHGGNDHGASGAKTKEKDINLAVALRVGRLLKEKSDNVKVIYTRDNDTFITLQGRCDKANRAKGDIFVSIHTNSVDAKSPNRTKVCGASVYTLGLERSGTNLDVAMRENSVMKLEKDYSTTYCGFDPNLAESYIMFEMSQSAHIDQSIRLADEIQHELCSTASRKNLGVRQAPFWVLVRTSMPAVLVELDFICNPDVEAFLGSDSGRDKLAKAIYNGIESYRRGIRKTASKHSAAKDSSSSRNNDKRTKDNRAKQNPSDKITYRVQFLTSPRKLEKKDNRLDGIDEIDTYTDGKTVKYTSGNFASMSDAQKRLQSIRRKFPDAFIIKMRDGKRIN